MASKGINWSKVDFSRGHNEMVARQIEEDQGIKVSREMVRIKRNELGQPKVSAKGLLPTPAQDKINAIDKEDLSKMYIYQICQELGVSDTVVREYIKNNNIKLKRGVEVYPFHEWNWKLPNKVLEEIWGAHPNTAATRRNTHKLETAKWNIRFGRYPTDDEFNDSITQEQEKAVAYKEDISSTRLRMKERRTRKGEIETTITT